LLEEIKNPVQSPPTFRTKRNPKRVSY